MKTSWKGLYSRDIVKKARLYQELNQSEFGLTVEKSQEMISKYESGEVAPPSNIIIHCMNIIEESSSHDVPELDSTRLLQEWKNLKMLGDSIITSNLAAVSPEGHGQ